MHINKDVIRKLSDTIMIDLTEDEINQAIFEFEVLDEQIAHLKSIDTQGVQPMVYPFETPTTYLRSDEETSVLSQQEVLANAPSRELHFFKVAKVVNEE